MRLFSTAKDNQREIKVKIFEGEEQMVKDNHLMGVLSMPVPPAPARVPQIEIEISIDSNTIIKVKANNKTDG